MINEFKGKYFFLSNFYKIPIVYKGVCFTNNEAAFQSMKCPHEIKQFEKLTPSEAKKMGRHISLRSDWDEVKEKYMYEIVKCKFEQNKGIQRLLLYTGDEWLEEGNTWGDKIWGTVNGVGANLLGKILMKVRSEVR